MDWSKFPTVPEQTVYCQCGQVFRSNAKLAKNEGGVLTMYSQTPCPGCGKSDEIRRVSSDPEVQRL